MYVVIEMEANRTNPQAYGKFVRCRALVDDAFVGAYKTACRMLRVERPKMIHTVGVHGVTNIMMAQDEMTTEGEVQLFSEFEDLTRLWIFEAAPEKWDGKRP